MTVASCSDALRLVIAQKLLKKQKMGSFEGLACISPMCLLFMAPVAIFKVRWGQERTGGRDYSKDKQYKLKS
jgi:hypothetical protein